MISTDSHCPERKMTNQCGRKLVRKCFGLFYNLVFVECVQKSKTNHSSSTYQLKFDKTNSLFSLTFIFICLFFVDAFFTKSYQTSCFLKLFQKVYTRAVYFFLSKQLEEIKNGTLLSRG